ncbi:MAG: hypothetical protein LUE86_10325 [Clostridiales bacterium]|nr:hypothetical protein [Clostridiales bacterium]
MTDSEKLDLLLEKVGDMDSRLDSMDNRFDAIDARLDSIESNLAALKADHETTKAEVKAIRITLESETNRNIRLIAEGHINLDRKLNEALRSLHSDMMYHLKVNYFDAELQHVKEHLGIA